MKKHGLALASIGLGTLAVVNLAIGFRNMLLIESWKGDLWVRWVNQRYVARGKNPYDVSFAAKAKQAGLPEPQVPRDASVDPDIGPPVDVCYPPWSFFTAKFLVPALSWRFARIYYACLNLAALVLISVWTFRQFEQYGWPAAAFMVVAWLAVFANGTTLRLGQYGILVTLLLVAVLYLEQRGHHALAGLALGLAALKPQLSATFGFVPLVRRRWAGVAVAAVYIALATAYVCAEVGTGPVEMIRQTLEAPRYWQSGWNRGILDPLARLGLDLELVTGLGLLTGAAVCGWLSLTYRNGSLLTLAALAAVVGQLWTYHRRYDQVTVFFLLLALGHIVFKSRHLVPLAGFILVGLSLWIPLREKDWVGLVPFLQYATWIAGLVVVLRYDRFLPRLASPQSASVGPSGECRGDA